MSTHWTRAMRQARRIGKSRNKARSVGSWADHVRRALGVEPKHDERQRAA